jgi:hypothetical protein
MAKKVDYIPKNDGEFNAWFKNLNLYVGGKVSGSTPEWKHIPQEDSDALNAAYLDWYTFYAPMLKPHTKAETMAKNEARKRAEKVIRPFVKQYLHFKPVTSADRINMGIPVHDDIRTSHGVPTELVEFFFKLKGIRSIEVHFKVLGAANKAKPYMYDGAVIIWDVLDKPPAQPDDLNRHTLASRTPHTLSFKETERGKTVYVALCWQNEKAQLGPWSEIQSAVIP